MMGYWDNVWKVQNAPSKPTPVLARAADITIPLHNVMGKLNVTEANASYLYDNKRTYGKLGFYRCEKSVGNIKVVLMFPCLVVDGKVMTNPVYGTAVPVTPRYEDDILATISAVGDSGALDGEDKPPSKVKKRAMKKFNSHYMSQIKEEKAPVVAARIAGIKPIVGPTSNGTWCYSHSAGNMAYSVETGIQPVLNAAEPAHIVTDASAGSGIYFATATWSSGGISIGCTQKPASYYGTRYQNARLFDYSYLEVT